MKTNILVVIATILLALVAYNFYFLWQFRSETISLLMKIYYSTNSTNNSSNNTTVYNPTPTAPGGGMALDSRPLAKWRGVIKMEKIPADIELGDYWYQFYFEEPYLHDSNASGIPMYIDKMQILPVKQDMNIHNIILDDYLNKNVEVAGYLGWGYAESNLIEPIAIIELR